MSQPAARYLTALLLWASASAAALGEHVCRAGGASGGPKCENLLLQTHALHRSAAAGVAAQGSATRSFTGLMTMWTDSPMTVVDGSCEYANPAQGGLASPAATSPYIAARAYCAADDLVYRSGAACGSCYRVTYDGRPATNPGRPGNLVIQVVDSGSAKTFDCQIDAFETITGSRTGIFPITYEPVDCDVAVEPLATGLDSMNALYAKVGGPVVTVLDGMNEFYTKVIFSNTAQSVAAASIVIGGKTFAMERLSGATWQARTGGATGAASFNLRLDGGAAVVVAPCFGSWPVATNSVCAGPHVPASANSLALSGKTAAVTPSMAARMKAE